MRATTILMLLAATARVAMADLELPVQGDAVHSSTSHTFRWNGNEIKIESRPQPTGTVVYSLDSLEYADVAVTNEPGYVERVIGPATLLRIKVDAVSLEQVTPIFVEQLPAPIAVEAFAPVTLTGTWSAFQIGSEIREGGTFSIPLDNYYTTYGPSHYGIGGHSSPIIGYTNAIDARYDAPGSLIPIWAGTVAGRDFYLHYLGSHTSITFEAVPCDVAGNDYACGAKDIDALQEATLSGLFDPAFDINRDGVLDFEDRVAWVKAASLVFGDSNFGGGFTSEDFVLVYQAGEYEDGVPGNSHWATGDWDGNGDFESADYVLAFQAGYYEQPPATTVAVPEPSGWRLLGLALAAVVCRYLWVRKAVQG